MTITTVNVGTIEHIDPNLIVVEANVRTEAQLGRECVASIKANGVLTPVLARRDDQGNIIVRAGQRRTLAARQTGIASTYVHRFDARRRILHRTALDVPNAGEVQGLRVCAEPPCSPLRSVHGC